MFIVFEGIDGAGTTTHSRLLAEWLTRVCGRECELTFQPSSGPIGAMIKQALKGNGAFEPHPLVMAHLFMADRQEHLNRVIEPALAQGKTVICDRYNYSTLAYQGVELPLEWLAETSKFFRQPDLVIFLDIERIKKDGRGGEIYEYEDFLNKVRENYLNIFALQRSYKLLTADAGLPISAVQEIIRTELSAMAEAERRGIINGR